MKLTTLEQDVLRGIFRSEYADGDQPAIWSWSIRANVATPKQLPGVISSLVKKGLVTCEDSGEPGATRNSIWVTKLGAEVYKSLPKED